MVLAVQEVVATALSFKENRIALGSLKACQKATVEAERNWRRRNSTLISSAIRYGNWKGVWQLFQDVCEEGVRDFWNAGS